jgi:hypothetical protein
MLEFSARREIPSVRGRIGAVAVNHLSSGIAELLLHQHSPGAENNWVKAYNIISSNGLVSFRQLADLLENRGCPSIKTVPFHEWRQRIKEEPHNNLRYVVSTFTSDFDSVEAWMEHSSFLEDADELDPSIHRTDAVEALRKTIDYMGAQNVNWFPQDGALDQIMLGRQGQLTDGNDTVHPVEEDSTFNDCLDMLEQGSAPSVMTAADLQRVNRNKYQIP